MLHTSISLLERIRQESDSDAWGRFVLVYTPWINWVLRQASVSASDFEDLRQDVLTVVCQEISGFQHNGQMGAFRRWLRNIVINRLRSHWRKRRSTEQHQKNGDELQNIADPFSALEALWDREHDRHVTEALLTLVEPAFTQSTWMAFRRQVMDGQRAEEIASELGISINAVLLAKSRVLRRLRDEARGLLDEI
jgi:RNA polymerase sigma-70 factor (ECF subfamily)